jgi:glycosyltransferase involved in cell wall biosynthesis
MKILRIIARLNVGGPARHVVWLTEALNDDEFRTTLAAGSVPPGEEDMGYFAAEHNVEPQIIEEMSREISPSDIRSLWKIYRLIKAESPDIIHTHTAKAGTLGRAAGFLYKWLVPGTLIGRPRKVRVVHTFHGHVFHSYYSPAKTKVFLTIERLLARLATDRIVVISNQQREEISATFHVGKPEQFTVIPLGIEVDTLQARTETRDRMRREIGLEPSEIAVGFVGRLTEIKNISLLLRTARLFLDESKIKFFIIGDGHMRSELESEAQSLGLNDKVIFLGNRTNIAEVYCTLDIVALTSLNEGTPLSLIEAMAAGVPIISTGVGGVRDLLGQAYENGDGFIVCDRGIRIDTFVPEDYRNGLQYLIDNERIRERLAEQGQKFVTASYGKERLISDIKGLYRDLIGI